MRGGALVIAMHDHLCISSSGRAIRGAGRYHESADPGRAALDQRPRMASAGRIGRELANANKRPSASEDCISLERVEEVG